MESYNITAEALLTLAHAAEWMAENSTHEDRDGRCSAYLMAAARDARRAIQRARDEEWCGFCKGQPVGNAARWLGDMSGPDVLPCPRCGEVNA